MINNKACLEKFAQRVLRIAASSAFIWGIVRIRESWEISLKHRDLQNIMLLFSYY